MICKGGSAYSDDLKTCEVNSQEVKDGLNLFGDLVQSKAMPDDTAAKSLPKEQLFVSGHAAMYTLGGFETKLIAEEVGDNFHGMLSLCLKWKMERTISCTPQAMPC
ncbi:MAG: hypothetical protein ACLRIL_07140 [Fusicatenibacter saccharivorans]